MRAPWDTGHNERMALTQSHEFIARRYDRLAPLYRLVELAFGLPPGIRRRAVAALALRPGDRVTELGCGSGRNLELIADAVGLEGAIRGVDLSEGMLGRASQMVRGRGWENVTLLRADAAGLDHGVAQDAVLFSLSYAVMPDRHAALARAWESLRPGGRLVIMDACLPEGPHRRFLRPVGLALSRATVLGDPDVRPWDELAAYDPQLRVQRLHLGTYVVVRACKSAG